MEQKEVLDKLRGLCARVMSVPEESVVPQARLVGDLGADSLDFTELEVVVRDVFGIDPEPSRIQGAVTVGDVAELIVALRAGTPAGEALA
ncbi:acyl carrier protein [Streptomyces sp. NPDC002928]|uniref:acyl carrier protein n=1 Tax=Streptomyces sp. NPDC002928 TaxID=3154440 RepID=UPI0033A8F075